ncbi:hypothetical protein [Salibacter halophilus]|uniref:DUF3575 domain-containing protein n=1 Tax=Salibacter halophilus TaxID=1803916 RepID=A0A6N6M9A9_9FLAO|nr:hypothetical protein [Salibacter halophilus]KAB1064802.1 hypothetical protein F3059_05450 [Salibacter halophilus]
MHYRIIVFLALFISSVSSVAQIDSAVKEMRWKVTTLLMQDRSESYTEFHPTYFNGIGVKYRTRYLTVRAGVEHYGYLEDERSNRIKLGIEKGILLLDRIRPYLAAQVYTYHNKDKYYVEPSIYNNNSGYVVESNYFGVGGMYSLGLEVIITKYISLAVETRFIHESITRDSKAENFKGEFLWRDSGKRNSSKYESFGMVTFEIRLP